MISMRIIICFLLLGFFLCDIPKVSGQFAPLKVKKDSVRFTMDIDSESTIELNSNEIKNDEIEKNIKKKDKKNMFYGIKTKKRFIKTAKGRDIIIEKFYLLKEYVLSPTYSYYKYYYDITALASKRRIVKTTISSKKYGMPLHGIYERIANGRLIEKGYFYYGVKHGRWEKFNKDGSLIDKKKWFRGFPKDSKMTYYDGAKTKLKEVIPIHHGIKDGMYIAFYESGNIAMRGLYKEEVKIGTWIAYYDKNITKKKKKETQYRKKVYNDSFRPFTKREWDENGVQTISSK